MTRREYDPLAVIPSAKVIRQRLEVTEERARRLRVLLRTAEQIEQDGPAITNECGQALHAEKPRRAEGGAT